MISSIAFTLAMLNEEMQREQESNSSRLIFRRQAIRYCDKLYKTILY